MSGTAEFLHWVPLRVVAVHCVIGCFYGEVPGDGEGDAVKCLTYYVHFATFCDLRGVGPVWPPTPSPRGLLKKEGMATRWPSLFDCLLPWPFDLRRYAPRAAYSIVWRKFSTSVLIAQVCQWCQRMGKRINGCGVGRRLACVKFRNSSIKSSFPLAGMVSAKPRLFFFLCQWCHCFDCVTIFGYDAPAALFEPVVKLAAVPPSREFAPVSAGLEDRPIWPDWPLVIR